ncbi:hypothetical protein BDN72DRAFT_440795 [Pluteus cervinus]|uniref:Uncharacterized protein n=1 Tax=Pluteus cervinus TaxID=181527 RepID=A0ACD3BEP4_9AGAR|nr:hypothetical protein BDN72DRAFT_440795 [Pluteus cervinus]
MSRSIDTPGVIERVSQLFSGHPSLIQGFNTFLPVGYRIECSTDLNDNYIRVTTPTGTTMQSTSREPGKILTWSTTHVGGQMRNESAGTGFAMGPAVQYVQKIKQRCDPETYRQFLDILSRYQDPASTLDHEEVSKQIALLFKDAPDLRSDFKIFMPERGQHLREDNMTYALEGRTKTSTPTLDLKGKSRKLDVVANSASAHLGSGLPAKRKRKVAEKEREREKDLVPVRAMHSSNKKLRHSASQDLTPASYSNQHSSKYPPGPSSPPPASHSRRAHQNQQGHHHQQHQNSQQHNQFPPQARPYMGQDEIHFFDRVRRALDNRDTYNEFLKVVNLFTQDFIDTARLIKESRNFLGDTELLRQFKEILGWDEKKEREHFLMEQQQKFNWTRPVVAGVRDRPSRIELTMKYGSYRRLPASDVNVACTGRDEMCRSVLNDEWVSHPTWSSEDSGFIAHKKNIYEEALHRSEEERHEYDFHIDAIARAITLLDPIAHKINQLPPEERHNFKLKQNLGGQAKPIHYRVIKKIYGREPGLEVIQSMQDTPAVAIPVVLQRLKQKEEEWKRGQREWNKVWREVDARNYTKSLDHQGITFKAADKKALTTKAFVSQIEAAREEQIAKRASLIDPLFARTRPRHQLEYPVDDQSVLQDTLKLTFCFLDRTQAQINLVERKRIESFLRTFVPLFFDLDPVAFNSAFAAVHETVDGEGGEDVTMEDAEASASHGNSTGKKGGRKGGMANAGGDLRKKLLKSEQAKSTNKKTRAQQGSASPSASRVASPVSTIDEDPKEGTSSATTSAINPQPVASTSTSSNQKAPKKNIFLANTAFYVLIRLIEVVYSRLSLFKGIAASLAAEGPAFRQATNPTAATFGLPTGNHADSTNFGDRTANAEHFYELLLDSCERLFDNEVEQHAFEDLMRYIFGVKHAYKIFAIDKVIGILIKQVQAVFADPRSQELLENLKRDRAVRCPTTQDVTDSRNNADKILGPDENLFQIDWLAESKVITIRLLGKDDSSFDDSEIWTGRWQTYIESYVSSEHTEGVLPAKVTRPFLRRTLPAAVRDQDPKVYSQDGIEMKVCIRTYRLFYVARTEDFLWKPLKAQEVQTISKQLKARNRLRQKWMAQIAENPLKS